LDLGIELGQRGTVKNNLIRENFLNFTIGINFANKWFEKQYFD
jgi:putative outer membrane protein